jgi:hypothetical protein
MKEDKELKIKKAKFVEDVNTEIISKGLGDLLSGLNIPPLFDKGRTAKQTVKHVDIVLMGGEKVLAIYPIHARGKFSGLSRYAGYSERLATAEDIEKNQCKVWRKKKRAPNADDKRGFTKWDEIPKRSGLSGRSNK